MWILLVISTWIGEAPDVVSMQEFSSRASCDAARAWVVSNQAAGKLTKTITATCMPK